MAEGRATPLQSLGSAITHHASLPDRWSSGRRSPARYRSLTHDGHLFEGHLRTYSFYKPTQSNALDRCFDSVLPAGSVRSSVFNLCSATLGAGALSLPVAFREAGFGLCLALLAAASFGTVFSIWLLIDIYERTDIRTYEESTESLAGKSMRRVVEFFTIVFCYGTAVAYIIAVGDTLAPLQEISDWVTKPVTIVAFWLLFMLPTSCLREVNSLRFTSFFGVLVMLYLTAAIGSDGLHELVSNPEAWERLRPATFSRSTVLSMPVVLFAYTCQPNVFAIYDELQDQSPRKMLQVAGLAMVLCLVVYVVVGFMGYARFGAATKGDILTNYDFQTSPIVIKGIFVAMATAITTAFPLNVFPMRTALNLMLFGVPQLQSTAAHVGETLLIVGSMLLAALYVPGVDIVFSLLGSTASSLLCFILPAYLGYCAGSHKSSVLVLVGMVALVVVGVFIGVLGTWCTITERLLTS